MESAGSLAACAPSNGSDGHAPAGAKTAVNLTLQVDHSMGADQQHKRLTQIISLKPSIS
jgi:hypothetical protein